MTDDDYRILPARKGRVQCLPEKKEPVENCGFCIHCREFGIGGNICEIPVSCLLHEMPGDRTGGFDESNCSEMR